MTDTPSDNGSPPTDSMSVTEAAVLLGVSERTVLCRIRKQELRAYKIPGERGDVWRVMVDGMTVTPATQPGSMSDTTDNHAGVATLLDSPPPAELMKALEMVDRLQQDNQQLAGQVGFLQAKLQSAEEQFRLLSGPKDEPEPARAPEPAPVQRAPWWKRVFNG